MPAAHGELVQEKDNGVMAAIRYTVLGPVRAWRGGTELTFGPPKQRDLLALLLVRTAGPLSVHEAVDVLWGESPPNSAVNVVHRHVGGLRRLLEPQAPSRAEARQLIRTAGGYQLVVDAGSLDLLRFRVLRAEAQLAVAAGEREAGARLLVEALGLWHGPVAAGNSPHVQAHPVFTAVENEYVAAAKEAADVAPARLPLVEAVLTALRRAADRRPMDEALQARIITALAATGRQAEALELFQTVRSGLAEELGVDPGAELRAAHEHVLRQSEPASGVIAAVPKGMASQLPTEVRPAQLPADITAFAGRQEELARSLALLPSDDGRTAPVVIGAISGMAGVGKTTLAVRWAHMVADRFPDGQLYVNLRGFHPAMSPVGSTDAMRDVIDALGRAPDHMPDSPDALASLYRSLFAGRRFLILLDNARDTAQVRPLLPGAPGCLAIITSRHRLDGLVVAGHAHLLPLGLLTLAEGVELLLQRLGADRVSSERTAAESIVELCGRLPLALAIASARAVQHPTFSLTSIAAELRESRGGLDAFAGNDTPTDARSVFSWSYQALSPATARLFRLLSLHPAAHIAAPAAASLTGVPLTDIRHQIAELVEHNLLTEYVPGRFACHELLRAYAGELCGHQDNEDVRTQARRRMFEHYESLDHPNAEQVRAKLES
jgi:DNA-binding SARP family transcriptional activator